MRFEPDTGVLKESFMKICIGLLIQEIALQTDLEEPFGHIEQIVANKIQNSRKFKE